MSVFVSTQSITWPETKILQIDQMTYNKKDEKKYFLQYGFPKMKHLQNKEKV